MNKDWFVYILECKDQSLYTGITTNLKRRVIEHNTDNKKGAKSLRGKRPVKLVYYESFDTIIKAASREKAIKNWKRINKLKLINKGRLKGFTL
ncbi:endonuclease [Candidatus Roizmanbacteria bacterium CG_4_9_14_0_2_um_filter_36_12]|uniref:Endonuclease n=2 Tax=Candidatus Roizmaniibacteriota TaxID=1752723 RepID=A0A2M8EXF0_9BACT|nr:MAG: endonuclease [Candidatus Roizmanbacteria bacterium CG_4_9_14_0_2_um_filter_36_12]